MTSALQRRIQELWLACSEGADSLSREQYFILHGCMYRALRAEYDDAGAAARARHDFEADAQGEERISRAQFASIIQKLAALWTAGEPLMAAEFVRQLFEMITEEAPQPPGVPAPPLVAPSSSSSESESTLEALPPAPSRRLLHPSRVPVGCICSFSQPVAGPLPIPALRPLAAPPRRSNTPGDAPARRGWLQYDALRMAVAAGLGPRRATIADLPAAAAAGASSSQAGPPEPPPPSTSESASAVAAAAGRGGQLQGPPGKLKRRISTGDIDLRRVAILNSHFGVARRRPGIDDTEESTAEQEAELERMPPAPPPREGE